MKIVAFATYVTEAEDTKNLPRLDVKESAAILRANLKKLFPSTDFRVKLSRYSGGSSINVSWVDGPTAWQVDEIANAHEGEGFDGMTDSRYSKYSVVTRKDGTKALASYSFVFTNRNMTKGLYEKLMNILDRKGFAWAKDGTVEIKSQGDHAYPDVNYAKSREHAQSGWDANSIEHTIRKYARNLQGNGILAVKKGEPRLL